MKIAKVEAIPVSYPEPNDFNALRHLCLAKITADDGQIGWGEDQDGWRLEHFQKMLAALRATR